MFFYNMRKSQSCPALSTMPTHVKPICPMRKNKSNHNLTASAVPWDLVATSTIMSSYVDERDFGGDASDLRNEMLYIVSKVPVHHVGLCLKENVAAPDLAACIASPCDAEDKHIDIQSLCQSMRNKTLYVVEDQNRAGTLLSRVRRNRKKGKTYKDM